MIRRLYYQLTPKQRLIVRKMVYFPSDLFHSLFRKSDELLPPKGDIYTGSLDFTKVGENHVHLLRTHLGLRPEDKVLDIGSGIGRTAIALTKFMDADGEYHGFDIVEKGVRWCQSNISVRYPNFHFQHAPLYNDLYNATPEKAEEFEFPYPQTVFDKAFLFSVFTHMMVPEIKNYIREIDRVLKSDGACLATFFLYNEENEEEVVGQDGFNFPYQKDGYRLLDEKVKAANIALSEKLLQHLVADTDLYVANIFEGTWKRHIAKSSLNEFQDVVVLRKK